MRRITIAAALSSLAFAATGCGDDGDSNEPDAIADVGDTGSTDVSDSDVQADAPGPDTVDDAGDDTVEDAAPGDTTADVADDADAVDAPDVRPEGLPDALPFEYTRDPIGDAPTEQEIADFTATLTGFWDDAEYFRWVRMTSHGVDASNEEGWFHYALWWQDTQASREGDVVTFTHHGRADNLTLRTCKVLNNAIAGYLLTGDEDMRWIVENYSRGIAALAMVMEFGDDDDAPYLQSRAPFTRNHSYETVGGRQVVIDYDPVRRDEDAWNAAIIHNPNNPYWGDVHFVNQRSKDDVPHMMRSVPMLMRAVEEAPDESVRDAAALALEYLQGFSQHVVDSGYEIMTKYEDGEAVVPTREDGAIKDLASLVLFDALMPDAECIAKASVAYAAGGTGEFDCGNGYNTAFETIAATNHYFNYAIYRTFHVAHAYLAIMHWDVDTARALFDGLVVRGRQMLEDDSMPNRDVDVWDADVAVYLVLMATVGVPLTGDEAAFIQAQYTASAEHYAEFPYWDPWADGGPEGDFEYKPHRGVTVRPTELAHILEYCYSPLRSLEGAQFVDCDVVADRDQWGGAE